MIPAAVTSPTASTIPFPLPFEISALAKRIESLAI